MDREMTPLLDRPDADRAPETARAGAEDARLGKVAAAVDAIAHARDDRYRESKARAEAKSPT